MFVDSRGLSSELPDTSAETDQQASADPPSKPEPAKKKPTSLRSRDEAFLLDQNASLFTIQLLASYDSDEVQRHIKKNRIADKVRIFRTVRDGRLWYVVSYGLYDSAETARAAIAKLSKSLQRNTPWIRSLKSIHSAIAERKS